MRNLRTYFSTCYVSSICFVVTDTVSLRMLLRENLRNGKKMVFGVFVDCCRIAPKSNRFKCLQMQHVKPYLLCLFRQRLPYALRHANMMSGVSVMEGRTRKR